MKNIDSYKAAKLLIEQYGEGAAAYAGERMQLMLSRDDAKGAAVWLSIEQAITDITVLDDKIKH